MGSGRPGTRRSGNTDREHLQMGSSGGGWSKKESGDLQTEKRWRSAVEKVRRRALGGRRMGTCGG